MTNNDTSTYEMQLATQYPDLEAELIRHVLNEACGKNFELAQETLGAVRENQELLQQMRRSLFASANSFTPEQLDLIEQFKGISGANDSLAKKYLKNNSWDLMNALNFFYESGETNDDEDSEDKNTTTTTSAKNLYDAQSISALFQNYQRADIGDDMRDDALQHHALLRFCEDLETNPEEDPMLYIIAWLINATTAPYTFTKQEFLDGMDALGCETLGDIKASMEEWRQEIQSKKKFRDFYTFVFGFCNRGKVMRCATALTLWRALLRDREMAFRDAFLSYMQNQSMQPISVDAWVGILDFLTEVQEDSEYDMDDGLYPSVVDEFFEFRMENGGGEKQE